MPTNNIRSRSIFRWVAGKWLAVAALLWALAVLPAAAAPEDDVISLFREDKVFVNVPETVFNQLGWDLPDGGASVKALGDAASGGAFDPRRLETLDRAKLGYQARWHEVRYRYYGLDWEIGGLQLTPNQPTAGLPTLVIIHGGSANWYEFFVDQFNNPGLGQYLAQKVPVLLLTIPGNYKHGGWTEQSYADRIPAYLLSREISAEEARLRNAIYTFSLVTEGMRQIIEKTTTGAVVVLGHSTGGELPFLLMQTSLKDRMSGGYLGWGSGGPAMLEGADAEANLRSVVGKYARSAPGHTLRARSALEYAYASAYIGPLNPCQGANELEVAQCWFRQEERRRPQFKQELQDMEHDAAEVMRVDVAIEIRTIVKASKMEVDAEQVIRDLFSTSRVPMTGYKKMLWLIGKLDGHGRIRDGIPGDARIANEFRKHNPQTPIRVGLFDAPITHYGHMERPKQVAAGMVAGLKWLVEP